jgi:anti-sigma-K factor RskA
MATTGVLPMKEESVTDALLREFLLGKLRDEDRERVEDLFLTDSSMRERVLALEQDLIDDYLEDNLSEQDKERFVLRYAQTVEQRRKLRISGVIKDWAVKEARAPQPAPTASIWTRFATWLRLKPRFLVPIAVTIVLAVVLAIVWLNSRTEQRRHLAIEQELAQLNSPASLREVPAEISFDLRSVSVRSLEQQVEVKIPANIHFIELRLPWVQPEHYSMYQAEVRRTDSRQSFTISNIQATGDGQNTIRVRLPARMLASGNYQLNLTGVTSDGSAGSSEEYSFVVAK